tara:strand:- start:2752 stop:3159 length:408 start_codon:yes stop_codon:yes gene_type:complete
MQKIILLLTLISGLAFGENQPENKTENPAPLITEIPTPYWEFVDIIGLLTTNEIIEILGEPAKKVDIKMKSSKEVIASTWYYHNLNTDEGGKYFPTTELDIIDGFVEEVVFMNDVDEKSVIEGQKFEVKKPDTLF